MTVTKDCSEKIVRSADMSFLKFGMDYATCAELMLLSKAIQDFTANYITLVATVLDAYLGDVDNLQAENATSTAQRVSS